MPLTTLTSKGQVTIPKIVRESLCLHTGDKIDFFITENNEVLLRPITKTVDEVYGKLSKPGRKAVSIKQMDSAIRHKMQANYQ